MDKSLLNRDIKYNRFEDIKVYLPSIIAAVALLFLGEILTPGFISATNIANVMTQSSLLAFIAIGQALVFFAGNSGIDLSAGAFVSMGALMASQLSGATDEGMPFAIVMVIILGAVFGLCNGLGIQILKIPALAMTLAMGSIVNGFVMAYTQGKPIATVANSIGGVGKPVWEQLRPMMVIAIIAIIVMEIIIRKTRFGRSVYLIGTNRKAALLNGIKVNRTAILVYVIAGIIACVGGVLLAGYTGSAKLEMGEDYTMTGIAAVVIGGVSVSGGKGTFIGSALGSIVLIMLTCVLVALGMSSGTRIFFSGAILAIILAFNCRDARLRQ